LKKSFGWCWADLGQLPDAHPVTLSLPLINKTEEENKIKKLLGQDIDRKVSYQLPSQAKQSQLGENKFIAIKIVLDGGKPNLKHLSAPIFSPGSTSFLSLLHCQFLCLSPPALSSTGG